MDIRKKITEIMESAVADVFMFELDYVSENHGLKFREDLATSSVQYFPIVNELEEKLEIEIDFHDFQYESKTIGDAIDYVVKLYNRQHKVN
jgi:acyl carrier protein